MINEVLKPLNEQTVLDELAALRAAEVEELMEEQLLNPSASFVYASKEAGRVKGCISGKWFRNAEGYAKNYGRLNTNPMFYTLVNAGIWSAFYTADVMLAEDAGTYTARALVSLGLTESNKYGIPLMVLSDKFSPVTGVMGELGFAQLMGPTITADQGWLVERQSDKTFFREDEREKVLFVNRYR